MDQRLPEAAEAAPVDWRGLCQELLDEVLARPLILDRSLIDRTRTLLAQPEPEGVGPLDVELLALVPRGSSESDFYLPKGLPSDWDDNDFIVAPKAVIAFARAVLARWGHPDSPRLLMEPPSGYVDPEHTGSDREMLEVFYAACRSEGGTADEIQLRGLRAVLARFGGRPAPATAGEVEVREIVTFLKNEADLQIGFERPHASIKLTRAADLLERQAAPVPVAVSERLPEPEDCDAEGRCWWFCPSSILPNGMCPYWCLAPAEPPRPWFTHWLPGWFLPLPSGEPQP